MADLVIALFVVAVLFVSSHATKDEPLLTYDILYTSGKESYYQERWYECMESIQRALDDQKFYLDGLAQCRISCQESTRPENIVTDSTFELYFFDVALRRSTCLRKCKEKTFQNRPDAIAADVDEEFSEYKPYDFLQICAFKSGNIELAADAAYTFSLANPDHQDMQTNVEFFKSRPELNGRSFTNLEHKAHQIHYISAVVAYDKEDWLTVLTEMEAALSGLYQEIERCQLLCEGSHDHESFPDLYNAIGDHWREVAQCQAACVDTVSHINFSPRFGFLADMYHYLQYTYFRVNNMAAAAMCASSYLLLNPDDDTMLRNRAFYKTHQDVMEENLLPRQEAVSFMQRQQLLARQLDYIEQLYKLSVADEDSQGLLADEAARDEFMPDEMKPVTEDVKVIKPYKNTAGITITGSVYANPIISNPKILGPRDEEFLSELDGYLKANNLEIIAEGEEMLGDYRVVADGLLDQSQCQGLIDLAVTGAAPGDGYPMKSPHTKYEMFEGLTIANTVQLTLKKKVRMDHARMYLHATEYGRQFLEKYYNLQTPLFFHFTHLVCRTALDGKSQSERDDLSHPVHTDNCFIQPDGTCLRESPAYYQRDFSGLIYLNEEFEGGDFFFAHKNKSVQKSLRPKCGRMVGFEASDYHGVLPVTKGKRCAVAVWYTLDPHAQETAHAQAVTQLNAAEAADKTPGNAALSALLASGGYRVSHTETELNGPERFAAENLATKQQCHLLMELARQATVVGDGYDYLGKEQKQSPHTKHERFSGITVDRTAKSGTSIGRHNLPRKPLSTLEMFDGLGVLSASKLAEDALVKPEAVRLLLNISELSRDMVAKYFNLDKPLYFDYTHLACREALDDTNTGRTDLSHPIHADNCIIMPDNSCKKEKPAYTQRDYSAVLYLNDNFMGGDFFFTHQNFSIQSSVTPKCGRLVGFNASNYHGVKGVVSGRRCAIAMWFTLNPLHKEAAHDVANKILSGLDRQDMEGSLKTGAISHDPAEL